MWELRMGVFNQTARERVFEPETTRAMGIAFERACTELRLSDQSDPISKLLADRIIELARLGERNPDELCAQAVRAVTNDGAAHDGTAPTG
jgi:hypothetical protein